MNNIIKSGFPRILCRLVLAILLVGMSQSETQGVASRLKPTASAITSPVFRPAGCTFSSPMYVEILADEGCEIYYRTDGYTPTVEEQYKYLGPIVISSTTTFEAIAADANGNTSPITTSTYTCTRHGIGEGYNPDSPGNPSGGSGETQGKTYRLTVVTNPTGAGSAYANSYNLKAGTQTRVYTYNNTGFDFLNWTIEGEEVSKSTSFYYVMPEYDVTIVANYSYNPQSPGNPSPEEQKVKHPVVVRAIPSGAASLNPSGAFDMEENASRQIYAYPNSGWHLTGWTINGEQLQTTTSPINITMGEKALDIAAYFTYNPASPSNPGANYYNPTTGQVIIDDFAPGNLYDALSTLVGYSNFSNISSLIVKGEVTSNDLGNLSYFNNAGTIDISRTGGVSTLPGYTFSSVGASSIVLPSTISSIGNYAFRYCENLASLTIYAQEPPTCTSYTFSGFTNKGNCTVYVPASALELYESSDYWKEFVILPITADAHVMQVNLPQDASDGRYKNNSLEIVNINSGVRQKYVVSDRLMYTFNGLQKDEQYNVYMYSQAGLEIGRIENIMIPDQDIEVTFESLKELYNVSAKVSTPDGKDVTGDATVEWLKPLADGTTTYLRKATSLGEIPDGQALICRVTLDNKLGTTFAQPEDTAFTVNAEQNVCDINLQPFRSIDLSGTVVDGDGAAISGASISVNQILNGKFTKSYTAKSDRNGEWRLTVLDAPETRLTYAANECVNVNDTIGAFNPEITALNLGQTTLKSIVGARVTYGFTYHAAGVEEVQDYYADYQNVLVSVFNVTQDRAHNDVSLQYPILAVLDENINTGDELRLTATSKTGAFNPIVENVTVGENQRAEVTFDITGKGGISASFEMTENPAVTAMLYSSNGELLKKQAYSEAQVKFTELEDGDYTLVSMGQSDLMNSILRLSSFSEIGLTEGKDYVKNAVKVESGKFSEVKNTQIPPFDESIFYYTNSSTSFSSNKSSITTGNYLTLRSAIDFKGVYKNNISNVALVVDLPEACDFVEQSVIQGPNLLPYTLDNNRLTIQLGNAYTTQTRFCVIPTTGGSFNATASVVFDYNGKTVTQPIGSAISEVSSLAINAPTLISRPAINVSGQCNPSSIIDVIWDGEMIARCHSNAKGEWQCSLDFGDLELCSTHYLTAQIETKTGQILQTETKIVTFDDEIPVINKVTMINTAHPATSLELCEYVTEFDFLGDEEPAIYWYWPSYPKFTFIANISEGSFYSLTDVTIYALTESNTWVPMKALYDATRHVWVAAQDFHNGNLPLNVGISYKYVVDGISVEKLAHTVNNDLYLFENTTDQDLEYEAVEENGTISFNYTGSQYSDIILNKISVNSNNYIIDYSHNGQTAQLSITFSSVDNVPDEAYKYNLDGHNSFYILLNDSREEVKTDIYYQTSFVKELASIAGLDDSLNNCFKQLLEYSNDSKFICISLSLLDGTNNAVVRRTILDDAENNCPELAPIIDRMKRRAEHGNRMNNNLNRFRRPLDYAERAANYCGPLGRAVGAAIGTGNQSIGFGQNAGNYINGLADRNDMAALEAAGCIPPQNQPTPTHPNHNPGTGYVQDPSGYVYEAVPNNRVEGVQATIYYKETKEDMYGDPYEEIVLWNAEEYAQKNPLFTDEYGMYQWDVPQGLWQVKFEKDGYVTAYSEWLPVPPPQLEVNIGIVQNKQPEVTEAKAYSDGVEVQFDKYMDPATLNTDNIFVTANGKKLAGEVKLIDSALADEFADENDEEAVRYASRVRFVPEESLSSSVGEIRLTVSRNVHSYAGIPMTQTFAQVLDVEKEIKEIVAEADIVKVLYGGDRQILVSANPYDAAVGKTLRIANSSSLIAGLDAEEVELDENGQALITVKGELPGRSHLTFTIADTRAEGGVDLDVVTEIIEAQAPKASRASGTAVYRGTKVQLLSESDKAEIYYTIDGSCPCDAEGTRRKYSVPIVIDGDVSIKAVAVVQNEMSEISEFDYTLRQASVDIAAEEGWNWISHNLETPVALADAAASTVDIVKSADAEAVRDPQLGLVGGIDRLEASSLYKMHTSGTAEAIRLQDVAFNPSAPVAMTAGWNWIGYPLDRTLSVTEALSPTLSEMEDYIVGQNGFSVFDGEKWIGELTSLVPGSGYMYFSASDKDLQYDVNTVGTVSNRQMVSVIRHAPWMADRRKYADAMPVIAEVYGTEGSMLDDSDVFLGAFSGSECRGVGRYIGGYWMVNVWGQPGDEIAFRLLDVDADADAAKEVPETVMFEPSMLGSISAPYTISLAGATGVTTFRESAFRVAVDGDMLSVSGPVESLTGISIHNAEGVRMLSRTSLPDGHLSLAGLRPGVYVVTLMAGDDYGYFKIIVK